MDKERSKMYINIHKCGHGILKSAPPSKINPCDKWIMSNDE